MNVLPDVVYHRGFKDSPLCLFIHGLGMNRGIWTEPEKTKILAGRFPLTVLLSKPPPVVPTVPSGGGEPYTDKEFSLLPVIKERITTGLVPRRLRTSFHDLKAEGFSVMAYTQKRPASDCMTLLEELRLLLDHYRDLTGNGIILIAHSRGGLVARKALELLDLKCLGLVTLATPHRGSALAKLAGMLSGISRVIYPFFENAERGTAGSILKRITEYLKSEALRELLPDSPFIRSLDDGRLRETRTLSFGGTDPTLLTVYRWREEGGGARMVPLKLFTVPEILTTLVPAGRLPEELVPGRGDGLVSKKSSEPPHTSEHHNHSLNHAGILFAPAVRKRVSAFAAMVC